MSLQMNSSSRNPWLEFVRYREDKLKKIRIGKPRMETHEVINWLKGLSAEMRDLDNDHQASCIHEEIGELYLNGKSITPVERNEARKEFHMAARLTSRYIDSFQFSPLSPISSSSAEDLFNKAIHQAMMLNDLKLAGIISLEAGEATSKWRHNEESSIVFYERASRLLEGEMMSQSIAYFHLIHIHAERDNWYTSLGLLDDLWMMCMKSKEESPLSKMILIECEICTAVILCMLSPYEVTGRHKIMYEMYSRLHPAEINYTLMEEEREEDSMKFIEKSQNECKRNRNWNDIPDESCLDRSLFWKVKDIIWMIYYGQTDSFIEIMEDEEEMEKFPPHSKRMIQLCSDPSHIVNDGWRLRNESSRSILSSIQLNQYNDLSESQETIVGMEKKDEDEEGKGIGRRDDNMDMSWRMGRLLNEDELPYRDEEGEEEDDDDEEENDNGIDEDDEESVEDRKRLNEIRIDEEEVEKKNEDVNRQKEEGRPTNIDIGEKVNSDSDDSPILSP